MALQLLSAETTFEVKDTDLPGIANPCEDVSYTLRQMPPTMVRAMAKKFTRQRPNPSTHRMEDDIDVDGLAQAAIDYVLVSWVGVNLPDGTAAPCTIENKFQGLDPARRNALTNLATSNSAQEGRADSFRSPAGVL